MPKLRFYVPLDDETILLERERAQREYHEFVGTIYDDIDEFMEIHKIAPKHKKYIESGKDDDTANN